MLYQIRNGAVAYADRVILKEINFEIRNTEKIAVVGRNGCGKTTLLKLMMGEIPLLHSDGDDGEIITAGKPQIGYLQQMTFADDSVRLSEEIRKVFLPVLRLKARMEDLLQQIEGFGKEDFETKGKGNEAGGSVGKKTEGNENEEKEKQAQLDALAAEYSALEERFTYLGGYRYEKDYAMILDKFGFLPEDEDKMLSEFSGGQRTKIAFIKLLLSKPDILLLDEPTNHLDISTITWLEGYLKEYPRAVVIVSHDRMFLDRIADVVYEIEHQKIKRYPGNYSEFVKRKRQEHEKQAKEYEAQQKEIARLMDIVERFKNTPTKVSMTHSKLKQIEHMERIEKPESYDDRAFRTSLVPARESGNDVLNLDNLGIGYEQILARVTLDMKKGQKVGIIGGNGLGKSTLLKTLVGSIPKKSGKYQFGYNVEIGYFDQQMAQYQSEKQVIDELWDEFPTLTQTEVRNILGGFLFTGDDVFKKVSSLSGGEKVRLALARIFQTRPNFLILDEPTNHMDIVGKEALEEMLRNYTGSVLFVSHDRYFVKQIANALLVFQEDKVFYYPYGYEDYEQKYGSRESGNGSANALRINIKTENAAENAKAETGMGSETVAAEKKNFNPGKEKAKRERRIARLEQLIEEGEALIATQQEELANPEYATDYMKLGEIQKQITELEEKNEAYIEEWTRLMEESE
ncbi:MAG: ABC-F family ATP-binding cassette domain-containing protein [Lachnospiraceae bacterium]